MLSANGGINVCVRLPPQILIFNRRIHKHVILVILVRLTRVQRILSDQGPLAVVVVPVIHKHVRQKIVEMATAQEERWFVQIHKSRKQAKLNAAPVRALIAVRTKRVEISMEVEVESHAVVHKSRNQAPRHAHNAPSLNVVFPKRVEMETILNREVQSLVLNLKPPKQAPRHAHNAPTSTLNGKVFMC